MKMKFRGDLIKLNKFRFESRLHEALVRLWGDATIAFLKATATQIHVDTGMSLASLVPSLDKAATLGSQVNVGAGLALSITGKARKGVTDIDGTYDASGYKSIKSGILAGQNALIITTGSPSRPVFTMEFKITVFQHNFWERIWNSLPAGQDAFFQYLSNNFNSYLPPLNTLFDVKRVD